MGNVVIETKDYLNTADAAAKLGLDTDTVKRYCNAKPPRLKGIKLGKSWLIPKAEIERYRKEESSRGRPKKRPARRQAS
jgi:hypothetical protein